MTPADLVRAAGTDSLPPVVLTIGAEQHLQGEVWHAIRSCVLKDSVPGLNEDIFVASETAVELNYWNRTHASHARTAPLSCRAPD